MTLDELIEHLTDDLADDGHGFITGIPIVRPSDAQQIHDDDHRPNAWWAEVLQHRHDQEDQ